MTTATLPSAPPASQDEYLALVAACRDASARYYGDGDTPLDDATYDQYTVWIEAWEAAHPDQVSPDSPTGKVGGGVAPAGDVTHTVPMQSLEKAKTSEQLATWESSLTRRLGRAGRSKCSRYSVEVKLDGSALAARYRDGELVQLVMRGDHASGEDVSHHIGYITGLPVRLASPLTTEIRGEVVMTDADFQDANHVRVAHNDKVFSNPRNATSGSLRAKDRPYRVGMNFYAYAQVSYLGVEPDPALASHHERMEALAAEGVQTLASTPVPLALVASLSEAEERIAAIAKLRPALPFGIDGVVVKADALADQTAVGSATHHPYWAVAFKLAPVERQTVLEDVEWSVGRTGVIAPRARLAKVVVDGSEIQYATLHNPDFIADSGLMLGDTVTVWKAGDIIPRIVAPVVDKRDGTQTAIPLPEVCPQCQGPIDKTEKRWRCAKGTGCGARAAVKYAAGRDQLDIEGLGAVYVENLFSSGLVADVGDLFTLTREQWAQATGSDKRAESLLAQLEQARTKPLNRVFCALGVPKTGRTMSRHIARHFGTMDAIRAATAEDLAEVDGLAGAYAPSIAKNVADLGPVIDKLVKAGVNMTEPETSAGTGEGPLAGQLVVVTGGMSTALAGMNRNQVNELIDKAGGKSSGSVTSKTTLLVAGTNAGSKLAKANSLGIRVVDEDTFGAMVVDLLA